MIVYPSLFAGPADDRSGARRRRAVVVGAVVASSSSGRSWSSSGEKWGSAWSSLPIVVVGGTVQVGRDAGRSSVLVGSAAWPVAVGLPWSSSSPVAASTIAPATSAIRSRASSVTQNQSGESRVHDRADAAAAERDEAGAALEAVLLVRVVRRAAAVAAVRIRRGGGLGGAGRRVDRRLGHCGSRGGSSGGQRLDHGVVDPDLALEGLGRDGVPAHGAEVRLRRERLSAVAAPDDGRRLGRGAAAVRAEVRAAEDRGAALALDRGDAPRDHRPGGDDRVELVDPLLDREHLGAARVEQRVAPVVPPRHLDGEAADVAHLELPDAGQLAPLPLRRDPGRAWRRAAGRLLGRGTCSASTVEDLPVDGRLDRLRADRRLAREEETAARHRRESTRGRRGAPRSSPARSRRGLPSCSRRPSRRRRASDRRGRSAPR